MSSETPQFADLRSVASANHTSGTCTPAKQEMPEKLVLCGTGSSFTFTA
jgi:hypothetical protein